MEQELSACLGEWQVAQLVEDQEIETGDQIGGPAQPVGARIGIQLVIQIDDVDEPSPGSVADTYPDNADSQMGFAGAGAKPDDIRRRHGISSATFYNWRNKYGGMDVSDAKRLRELEAENAELKRIVADQMLDMTSMKDLLAKNW